MNEDRYLPVSTFIKAFHYDVSGGAKQDRTADLLRARQALSQLSYSPKISFDIRWLSSFFLTN